LLVEQGALAESDLPTLLARHRRPTYRTIRPVPLALMD
jgi:hypothetical protein